MAPRSRPAGAFSSARRKTHGWPARRCRARSFCSSSLTLGMKLPRPSGARRRPAFCQAGRGAVAGLPCLPLACRASSGGDFSPRGEPMKRILPTVAALFLLPLAARAESELSLTLQGGAVKYDQALASPSDLGAEYGVRFGSMPLPVLGIELGYLGSQSNVRDVVNNSNTTRFISNGGYGDVRVNVLPGNIMPYIFGGFGVTNFKVDNEIIASDG